MRKLLLMTAAATLFLSAGCNCTWLTQRENADSIFAKMKKAIDVSDKQKNIKSAVIVYDTHLGKKEQSRITLKVKEKTGIRLEIRSGKSLEVRACNAKGGWAYSTGKGLRTLNAKEIRELKIEASYLSPTIKFDRLFASAKLEGSEKIDGVDNWKLICYPYAKFKVSSVTMFIDKKTYLVTKTVEANSKNEEEDITTYYGDYEEYNGIVMPFMMVAQLGGRIVEFKLISAEWNAEIANSEFAVPEALGKSK